MIVNVNPYDTGYDENSHVMRFSALAKEVSTVLSRPRVDGAFADVACLSAHDLQGRHDEPGDHILRIR